MTRWTILSGLLVLALAGCFGARAIPRNYYVLNQISPLAQHAPRIDGLVRVRTMDADSVYDKFQIVVRQTPYQLRYSETNLWAVKPDEMVSDLVARALEDTRTFAGVSRELGEVRPNYTLSGELHAIEVLADGGDWYVHLALTLGLTRFSDGRKLWSFHYDERKAVGSQDYSEGVRAISELFDQAVGDAVFQLSRLPIADRPALRPAPMEPRGRRVRTSTSGR